MSILEKDFEEELTTLAGRIYTAMGDILIIHPSYLNFETKTLAPDHLFATVNQSELVEISKTNPEDNIFIQQFSEKLAGQIFEKACSLSEENWARNLEFEYLLSCLGLQSINKILYLYDCKQAGKAQATTLINLVYYTALDLRDELKPSDPTLECKF